MAFKDSQWGRFLSTPGAKSSDPEFNVSKRKPLSDIVAELPTEHDYKICQPRTLLSGKDLLERTIGKKGSVLGAEQIDRISELMRGHAKGDVEKVIKHYTNASIGATTTASTTGAQSMTIADLEKMMAGLGGIGSSARRAGKSFGGAGGAMKDFGKGILGLKPDFMVMDEVADWGNKNAESDQPKLDEIMKSIELDDTTKQELEKLAAEMQSYFETSAIVTQLMAPGSLTTLVPTKGFQKIPHIGGEEFKPEAVYVGKKGTLIITFKPIEPARYQHMEMPLSDAITKLTDMPSILEDAVAGGYVLRMTNIQNKVMRQKEQQELEEKADVYAAIGFGSW